MAIPVLTSAEVKSLDLATINSEPISSLDLMERASWNLVEEILKLNPDKSHFHILCGPGNNGGDGLCIARILYSKGYSVTLSLIYFDKKLSTENEFNLKLIQAISKIKIQNINKASELIVYENAIIIDAIFGSGLKSLASDNFQKIIIKTNSLPNYKISIDMPSGLLDEGTQAPETFVQSDINLCIQYPRMSLLYNENNIVFNIVNIGLKHSETNSRVEYLDEKLSQQWVQQLAPKFNAFAHKGTRGHALLIGGSYDKSGAIALSAKACSNAGAGLTTVCSVSSAKLYLANLPEVMYHSINKLEEINFDTYQSIAIGPGLGQNKNCLIKVLKSVKNNLILDADALNMLSMQPELWDLLPPNTILTPHPKEFERLFGKTANSEEKIKLMLAESKKRNIIIVAKNKYTYISTPDGSLFINGTGSQQLAKGGSGDKLTGRIAAYLAQGTSEVDAAILGAFYSL